MKTKQLQTLWTQWMKVSESLLMLLHEQTAAVTMRDVARVERLVPDLRNHLEEVRRIDGEAMTEAKRLAEELGAPAQSLRGLIAVLEKDEAALVQATANKVLVNSQRVQEVMHKNRTLIEGEMTYVNGSLTLIAKLASDQRGPYRGRPTSSNSVLVDAAA